MDDDTQEIKWFADTFKLKPGLHPKNSEIFEVLWFVAFQQQLLIPFPPSSSPDGQEVILGQEVHVGGALPGVVLEPAFARGSSARPAFAGARQPFVGRIR